MAFHSLDTHWVEDHTRAAEELSGQQIGLLVQFDHVMEAGSVCHTVLGELRQIYHASGETVLNLCSHLTDTGGDTAEFRLSPRDIVTVLTLA